MAKEKEDEKLADAEKNPGIEKAEYDWMRLLPNLAKEMAQEVAGRASGSNSVDQDKSNVGVGEMTEVEEKKHEWKEIMEYFFVSFTRELAAGVNDSGQKEWKGC